MDAKLTGIDRGQVLRYLGCRGAYDAALEAELQRRTGVLKAEAEPRAVWKLFPLLPDFSLAGACFRLEGESVRALLKDCDQVILMAATLGSSVERLIRRTQAVDMAGALILDACGSAAIENVCDNLCAELAAGFAPRYLTDRFSPGYGDMPLSQQRELFAALDVTRRIGVTLTDSGLMLPQKSVTALIGVSDRPQVMRPRGCAACSLHDTCAYRKDGKHCGTI